MVGEIDRGGRDPNTKAIHTWSVLKSNGFLRLGGGTMKKLWIPCSRRYWSRRCPFPGSTSYSPWRCSSVVWVMWTRLERETVIWCSNIYFSSSWASTMAIRQVVLSNQQFFSFLFSCWLFCVCGCLAVLLFFLNCLSYLQNLIVWILD